MKLTSLVRFLNTVTPVRTVLLLPMAATLLFGIWLETQSSGSSDAAVIGLIFLQLFAVSTGFVSHARRGFYDPALERVFRRPLAFAHFFCSCAPGFLFLSGIGLAQLIAGGTRSAIAFRASAWTAVTLVSAVAWAVSLRGGPLSGGGLWLLVSIGVALSGKGPPLLALVKTGALGKAPLRDVVSTAIVYPIAIPSLKLPGSAIAILLGIAAAALVAGVEYVARAEFPIREEQ